MTILPPNATQLQRDLEVANDIGFDIEKALQSIKDIKSDPPPQILYWLIWEYGLGEILPYISDLNKLILDGLKWQRKRGTGDSLKMALSWINVDEVEIEQEPPGLYFYQYQLKFQEIPRLKTVDQIHHLAELSAPVRARLARLYNEEYDKRILVLSKGTFGQFLSDYSGYRYGNLRLSFGRGHKSKISFSEVQSYGFRTYIIANQTFYFSYPLLSYMQISDVAFPNWPALQRRFFSVGLGGTGEEPLFSSGINWFGTWNEKSWRSHSFVNAETLQTKTHTSHLKLSGYEVEHSTSGVSAIRAYFSCPLLSYMQISDVSLPNWPAQQMRFFSVGLEGAEEEPLVSSGINWFGTWNEKSWRSHSFVNAETLQTKTYRSHLKLSGYKVAYSTSRVNAIRADVFKMSGLLPDTLISCFRQSNVSLGRSEDQPLSLSGLEWFGIWNQKSWGVHGFVNAKILQKRVYTSLSGISGYRNSFNTCGLRAVGADAFKMSGLLPDTLIACSQQSNVFLGRSEDQPLSLSGLEWFGTWNQKNWGTHGFSNVEKLNIRTYMSLLNVSLNLHSSYVHSTHRL